MTLQSAHITPAVGEYHSRARVTRWAKGAWIGLNSGALFLVIEMLLLGFTGRGDLWDPVRLSASITLGNSAVTATGPMTADLMVVGLLTHFVLSIWYVVILGFIIRSLPRDAALVVGAAFGLVLYGVHFYGLTMLYPWVAEMRGWEVMVTHICFGVAAAWLHTHLHVRQLMREAGIQTD